MTADQVKGKGFRGALRYNLQKVDQGVAKILDMSFTSGKEDAIMQEVALVRMLRPSLQKYFYHTSLNFPPNENLADEQMNIIANEYLNNMGFDQHQYAIFRHFDADHPHLHILVNRIGYDGKVVSDSKDYQRSEQVLRRLEKQHGLTEVISSRQAQERAMTKNELEMMKRTDEPSVKMKLQVLIKNVLSEKPAATQFIQQLEAQGINVLFNQASTGFVSGISYGYEGMLFKGAHLGNAYKWQAVKNVISYEQERDRTAIYQANLRTREQPSARTGQSAGGGTATGADADTKVTAGNRKDVQQGTGKLQDQIGKANRKYKQAAGTDGQHGNQPRLSDTKDSQQRGTNLQGQPSGRQQVGYQALPDSDLIGSLLGTDHHAGDMDQTALNEFKRKRKKRKGQRMG
ncbi:relaxase/mobilization nuclease domain-containing protein [Mucilaginibacter aquariorum]|uniref:Relaxase/mobilization nuclease domain-containing protein n=1 Tax=Mucilaginibacter aquariorum TaxID=2967225 RepID=A0ABT1T204_9SPHI|nr:relaxase/mobilization nuclease domain-containing protein [Mucilaginibacter aquariorum]MCQ6958609.1 relaxase/mobilization nuclease domain-containing protein [Mucilaginibacter aquariorum]